MSLKAVITVRCNTKQSHKEVLYQINHAASILYHKDGSSMLLEHNKTYQANYMVSHPARR